MYKCLKINTFQDKDGYRIVPIRKEDIENIRVWRNAQLDILRQKNPVSPEEQQKYFQIKVWPTFEFVQPKQILFSFLFQNVCIGYGGLTNIDWEDRRAEVSFLVTPERALKASAYLRDFQHYLSLLCQVTFNELNFHRLVTETFSYRQDHMKILEDFGFVKEGVLREHIYKQEGWHDSIIHGLLQQEVDFYA